MIDVDDVVQRIIAICVALMEASVAPNRAKPQQDCDPCRNSLAHTHPRYRRVQSLSRHSRAFMKSSTPTRYTTTAQPLTLHPLSSWLPLHSYRSLTSRRTPIQLKVS